MLKNKLFFFNFFIFAFYVESFAMLGHSLNSNSNNIPPKPILVDYIINKARVSELISPQNDVLKLSKPDDGNYFLEPGPAEESEKKNFNKIAHVFFYFVISPLLNVNNLDWRHYLFQGQLNRGGVFFYYGLLNFGIGFNRKTFCDTCSCRIIGVNLFQFIGSFVLYFFVDKREEIKARWDSTKNFLYFLLFNDAYFKEHIENIDNESKVTDSVQLDSFMSFMCYSFSVFPFLSFFTFDFQLFEYLSFSLNIGSFLFLAVAFFVYTFYKHTGKPFGFISDVVSKYDKTFKDPSKDTKEDININIQLIGE